MQPLLFSFFCGFFSAAIWLPWYAPIPDAGEERFLTGLRLRLLPRAMRPLLLASSAIPARQVAMWFWRLLAAGAPAAPAYVLLHCAVPLHVLSLLALCAAPASAAALHRCMWNPGTVTGTPPKPRLRRSGQVAMQLSRSLSADAPFPPACVLLHCAALPSSAPVRLQAPRLDPGCWERHRSSPARISGKCHSPGDCRRFHRSGRGLFCPSWRYCWPGGDGRYGRWQASRNVMRGLRQWVG